MSEKTTILTKRRDSDRANDEAAAIILADVERAGGEGSASVQWARLYVARRERADAPQLEQDRRDWQSADKLVDVLDRRESRRFSDELAGDLS
jgi:hypothetical protein